MKNKTYLASLAMVLALASNVQAEGYVKVGILKYSSSEIYKDETLGIKKTTNDRFQLNDLSLSGGYIINNNIDVNGGLSFSSETGKTGDEKTTSTSYSLSLGANYVWKIDNKISPYAGLSLRYSEEKIKEQNNTTTITITSPYTIFGINYLITENVGLDLNVKISITDSINFKEEANGISGDVDLDRGYSEIGLNLLVKF